MLELIDLVKALFICRHLKLGVSDCSRQLSFLALYLLFNSHCLSGKILQECRDYICVYIYLYILFLYVRLCVYINSVNTIILL